MFLSANQIEQAAALFQSIQERLAKRLQEVDGVATIDFQSWNREDTLRGKGKVGLMRGKTVEKAGVNFSQVSGDRYPAVDSEHKDKPFVACGISTITHMFNPYAPIGHMNVRILDVGDRFWVGGGADLTPFKEFPEHTASFHKAMENACKKMPTGTYEKYRAWCDEYFYIPHRKSIRGVGGIFFDYLEMPFEEALDFLGAVAKAYVSAYPDILLATRHHAFTDEEKDAQLYWRGRYAEYNLIYDRGTKFGLMSGGSAEAIFVSLPPVVKW